MGKWFLIDDAVKFIDDMHKNGYLNFVIGALIILLMYVLFKKFG